MQGKRLQNKKDFINCNSLELSFYWFLYKRDILYIYIFLLLYRILAVLFFNYRVKLRKPSSYFYTCMIDSRKTVDIPLPQFSPKILKKHPLKAWFTWLVYISLYSLPYLIFAEISSTCNLQTPRFDLSVIIFLTPLLSSSSVKISFSYTLLVSETTFHFTAKISNALCYIVRYLPRDTKGLFNFVISGVKPCRFLFFSPKNSPAATRVWSKINYGDESTSSQTFNYSLCMFCGSHFAH